ncbi:MAG: hypothetical protein HY514_03795 [Candidatus Aenigmarchaeota archaeon]|nr:hypothetical protein [Candidatus Aenigmarchaeota archaeon]
MKRFVLIQINREIERYLKKNGWNSYTDTKERIVYYKPPAETKKDLHSYLVSEHPTETKVGGTDPD